MFDGFKKYAPGALDFVTGVVKQARAPGGISGQQAWNIAQGAVQQASAIAADQPAPAPPSSPGSPEPVEPASTPAAGSSSPPSGYVGWPATLTMLLQGLQQGRVPALPGYAGVAQPSPVVQAPPAAGQQRALDLLSLILTNPHLQQTLHASQLTGLPARTVQLPVPAPAMPAQTRSIPIPLGAVMNAIVALAGQSMSELNESTPEDDPEVPAYLVGDDGDFLVDPSSPTDRAALVAYLFRLNDEAQHAGSLQAAQATDEGDESEAWAEQAGFI